MRTWSCNADLPYQRMENSTVRISSTFRLTATVEQQERPG